MKALATALRTNHHLLHLNLRGCNIHEVGAIHASLFLAPGLDGANESCLHTLDLGNNPLGPKGVEAIAYALLENSKGYYNETLKCLNLSGTNAQANGVHAVARMLAENNVRATRAVQDAPGFHCSLD